MTNRRQFLGFGLAASVWPLVSPARGRSAAPDARLYKVICDRRYRAAAEFAAPLRAFGVPVHEIDGDVTGVWYHDLALRWRESPIAIVGLTSPEALFCLEQLAWDHRMHVVFRAERVAEANGRAMRRIAAPAQVILNAANTARDDAACLAGLAAQCPAQAALLPPSRMTMNVPARRGDADDAGDAWVAWAIAPVRRS